LQPGKVRQRVVRALIARAIDPLCPGQEEEIGYQQY